MRVSQIPGGITLRHTKYIENIIYKFGKTGAITVTNPLKSGTKLIIPKKEIEICGVSHQDLIVYWCTLYKLDIALTVPTTSLICTRRLLSKLFNILRAPWINDCTSHHHPPQDSSNSCAMSMPTMDSSKWLLGTEEFAIASGPIAISYTIKVQWNYYTITRTMYEPNFELKYIPTIFRQSYYDGGYIQFI